MKILGVLEKIREFAKLMFQSRLRLRTDDRSFKAGGGRVFQNAAKCYGAMIISLLKRQ